MVNKDLPHGTRDSTACCVITDKGKTLKLNEYIYIYIYIISYLPLYDIPVESHPDECIYEVIIE